MTKLPHNSLQNIDFGEIKTLLKENKAISGISDYVHDYVGDVLKNEGKFEKNDFEVMEGKIGDLKDYAEIIKEKIPDKKISLSLVNKLIFGQSLDEFRSFCDNKNFIDLIKKGKEENIKIFFGENFYNIKSKKDLIEFLNNKYIEDIFTLMNEKSKNIELFFGKDGIIKNIYDLEKLFRHNNIKEILNLIQYARTENIKIFLGKNGIIKNIDDLEKLFKLDIYQYLFIKLNNNELEKLANCFKNGFNKKNIGEDYNLLFPVKSLGSKVFDEIKDKMSKNEETEIYEILRNMAKNYLDKQKIQKQEIGNLEIAIYLRYKLVVDFPEIRELIIIFLQELIKINGIKGVKGIKILPRKKHILPRKKILDKNSRFCNIEGKDSSIEGKDFKKELNKNSIPLYLSHSYLESDGIAILSGGMTGKEIEGQLNLGLELENHYDEFKTKEKSIEEIFKILLDIVTELNTKNYDKTST